MYYERYNKYKAKTSESGLATLFVLTVGLVMAMVLVYLGYNQLKELIETNHNIKDLIRQSRYLK